MCRPLQIAGIHLSDNLSTNSNGGGSHVKSLPQPSARRPPVAYVPTWLSQAPDTCVVRERLRELELRHPQTAQHPVLQEHGYWLESRLGEGAYGAVLRAAYVRPRRDPLGDRFECTAAAVKVIAKHLVESGTASSVREKEAYIQLCVGTHANLVAVFMALETDHFMFIAMEFCAADDLLNIVKERRAELDERKVVRYAIHLCRAVAFLHSKGAGLCNRENCSGKLLLLSASVPSQQCCRVSQY